jgi:hypothetical protein
MTVQMKGNSTDPVTAFNFTCSGVDGCITTMQNLVTNLTTESQKLTQTKKTFITQANQSLESFKSQMTQVLNIQNQALQKRLGDLKKTLASNGVTDPLTTQSVQRSPLKKGENGLYEMPYDLLATIGGDMSPPLIDPNGGSFDGARASIASAIQNDEQKGSEADQVMTMILQEKQSCTRRMGEELEKKATNAFNAWGDTCAKYICYSGKDPLSNLDATVDSLKSQFGINDLSSTSDLSAGMITYLEDVKQQCVKAGTKDNSALNALQKSCRALSICQTVKQLDSDTVDKCRDPSSKDGSDNWAPTYPDPTQTPSVSDQGTCAKAVAEVDAKSEVYRTSLNENNEPPRKCDSLATQTTKATKAVVKFGGGSTDSGSAD